MHPLVAEIGEQIFKSWKLNKLFNTTSDYYCLVFLNLQMVHFCRNIGVKR